MKNGSKSITPSLLSDGQLQHLYSSLISGYCVPQSGLFLSFPRTPDLRLIQQSATYDEGIVGILLLKLGDLQRARAIVALLRKGLERCASGPFRSARECVYGLANFYNGYYFVEGVEKTMHVGPNAWIGLLASRAMLERRMILKPSPWHSRSLIGSSIKFRTLQRRRRDGADSLELCALAQNIFHENNLSTYAFMSDLAKSDHLNFTPIAG